MFALNRREVLKWYQVLYKYLQAYTYISTVCKCFSQEYLIHKCSLFIINQRNFYEKDAAYDISTKNECHDRVASSILFNPYSGSTEVCYIGTILWYLNGKMLIIVNAQATRNGAPKLPIKVCRQFSPRLYCFTSLLEIELRLLQCGSLTPGYISSGKPGLFHKDYKEPPMFSICWWYTWPCLMIGLKVTMEPLIISTPMAVRFFNYLIISFLCYGVKYRFPITPTNRCYRVSKQDFIAFYFVFFDFWSLDFAP